MIRLPACLAAALAPVLSLALVLAAVTGCGSGAVSAPATTPTATPVTVLPATATLYAGLPTTFTISGGVAPYFLTSSDQAVIPLSTTTSATSFTVVPNAVAAESPVTITVRDFLGTLGSASGNVKVRTISNVVTVTPSSSQPAACGSALCAGGDAEVAATLSQGGIAIQGRTVRFEVVSGDVRIITSPAGSGETLDLSVATTTDSAGVARIRVRALANAAAQTALIQAIDVVSGSFQRIGIQIAPSSSSPLAAFPSQLTFVGPTADTCANNVSAEVIISGGRPPYSISQPGNFLISPTTVSSSGGRVTVTAIGQCSAGSSIAIVDSNGSAVTITASNRLSESTPTPLVVAPNTVTLDTCTAQANVSIAGGTGTYYIASGSGSITASLAGSNLATIQRAAASGTASSPVSVGFTDGRTGQSVTVNLVGAALGPC